MGLEVTTEITEETESLKNDSENDVMEGGGGFSRGNVRARPLLSGDGRFVISF